MGPRVRPGWLLALLALLALAALVGCRREPPAERPSPSLPALPPPSPTAARSGDLPAVVRANNAFAVALYHRLRSGTGNLLVSPACLSAGLALVHAGARGETARQIGRVLRWPDDSPRLDASYAALIRGLDADGDGKVWQARLACAPWVQDGYPLLDAYRDRLRDVFGVEPRRVDFAGHRVESCRVINAWTAARTGGKIGAVLRPGDLPERPRLVLTSALYFRANWRDAFPRKSTRDAPFRLSGGRSVDVPTMNAHSYNLGHPYYDGGTFQALQLPCGREEEFAMVVLLPREADGLAGLEAGLTLESLDAIWPRFRRPEEIIVALPRYQIRAEMALKAPLAGLGMPLAFAPEADFSGINGKSGDLFLADVSHATFVDVNEEGIEAAAAMHGISPDSFGDEPPVFRADHPFLFLIRDNRSGCILFLGRVVDPRG